MILLLACTSGGTAPAQPPIQAVLSVHVEPLPHQELLPCEDARLTGCGEIAATSWFRRTRNTAWLLETWTEAGRTLDLQVSPELGLTWSGDAALLGTLASDETLGVTEEELTAQVEALQSWLDAALVSQTAALGVHLHTVAEDSSGLLGSTALPSGTSPCDAWSGAPLEEGAAEDVAAVLSYGIGGAAALADAMGTPLTSFTGHLPRTMAGKIALVEEPAASGLALPAAFQPVGVSSAYDECFEQAVDHPPFESWPAHSEQALLAGEGPLVLPGERVVGSMSEHLSAPTDGSWAAASRRLVQLLINWRHAALTGQGPRAWAYTFHVHPFQLEPGFPDAATPADRHDVEPIGGQAFRGDLLGVAEMLDELARTSQWQGVASSGAGVVEWILPEELSGEGSGFSYGAPDSPPPEGLDRQTYPYLPLVGERLADSHLVCTADVDGVMVFRFLRCAAGWQWGAEDAPGMSCPEPSQEVYALIPDTPRCLSVPDAALSAAAVDDAALSAAVWCAGGGLDVPLSGLLVEPAAGETWWPSLCMR